MIETENRVLGVCAREPQPKLALTDRSYVIVSTEVSTASATSLLLLLLVEIELNDISIPNISSKGACRRGRNK